MLEMVFSASGASCGAWGTGVEERRARRPTAAHALPRGGGAAGPKAAGPAVSSSGPHGIYSPAHGPGRPGP